VSAIELTEFTVDGRQHAALVPVVKELEGLTPLAPILDLGCGSGAWLARLADAGFRNLLGVDRNAEQFGAQSVATFFPGDLMVESEWPNGEFAFVSAIEVIEHVEDPERIIAVATRCLSSRGWLLVTTPNIYSVRVRTRFLMTGKLTFFDANAAPDHIHPLALHAFIRHVLPRYPLTLERVWSYPENGSNGSRWFARIIARTLGTLLPDPLPGDTICLLLRKH
jgi:SAM-dependent methyltransferase